MPEHPVAGSLWFCLKYAVRVCEREGIEPSNAGLGSTVFTMEERIQYVLYKVLELIRILEGRD